LRSIVRHKGDAVTQIPEAVHQVAQAQAARILVRLGGIGIDDQNAPLQAMIARAPNLTPVIGIDDGRRILHQFGLPALQEFLAIDDLEALRAAAQVSARGDAFVMNDGGGRLQTDFQSAGSHPERQVGVFVIRGGVMAVKAVQFAEQARGQHDAGAGTVVDLPDELVSG